MDHQCKAGYQKDRRGERRGRHRLPHHYKPSRLRTAPQAQARCGRRTASAAALTPCRFRDCTGQKAEVGGQVDVGIILTNHIMTRLPDNAMHRADHLTLSIPPHPPHPPDLPPHHPRTRPTRYQAPGKDYHWLLFSGSPARPLSLSLYPTSGPSTLSDET